MISLNNKMSKVYNEPTKVYLDFENALKMKEAGFTKCTHFLYHFEPSGQWKLKTFDELAASHVAITDETVVFAPTLSEIDLREGVCILKKLIKSALPNFDFVCIYRAFDTNDSRSYKRVAPTELEMRCYVWILEASKAINQLANE